MDVLVRERRASDSRAVRFVARKAWRATYEPIAPAAFIATVLRRGYARHRLLETLLDRRRDAFVAERDGRVIGYADWIEDPPGSVELLRIYLLPEEKGRGAGKALLAAGLAAAAARGARTVEALVHPKNRAALSWYERNGFARNGRGLFEAGRFRVPQIRMTLALAGGTTRR